MSRRILPRLLPLLSICLLCAAVQAQVQVQEPKDAAGRPDEVKEQLRQQNRLTAGVLLLVGVTAIGLLLIAASVIWGAKVRRLVRRPSPASGTQDDLWYLRNRLPPADPEPDEQTAPSEDRSSPL